MPDYLVSLAITTHNRRDELRAAVDSALGQSLGDRLEVVVVDDGSTDGTSEMLAARYGDRPNVKLDRVEPGIGLIAERNRFPELCSAPFIVSIDDDAVLASPRTIEQTLEAFEAHPRAGVVAIPYEDVRITPGIVAQRSPSPTVAMAAEQFRGTAHAIRKDVFVRVGRYRGQLWRQGEEQDLSIRLYDAGYAVLLGSADPIEHLESPKRSRAAIYAYTARNTLWYAWHNVPGSALPLHLAASTGKLLGDGLLRPGRLGPRLRGLAEGFGGIATGQRRERRPVSMEAYRLIRRLRKRGPVPLAEIEPLLTKLASG